MPVLTLLQLQDSLNAVCIPRVNYSFEIFDYYTNLRLIGCRPTELNRTSLWSRISPTVFKLNPTKNNYPRYIEQSQMTQLLIDAIDNSVPTPYGFKYWKQLYFFELWYSFQPCFVGGKSIDLYLFRHTYIKELFASGMTIPSITSHMGWVNPLMAENYIFSVITTP